MRGGVTRKGKKWYVVVDLGPDAKGNRRRTVALPARAVTLLRVHRKRQAEARLLVADRDQDHGLVFARVDGRPLDPHEVSKAFTALARKAGLAGLRFHDLRHSHASMLLKAGVGIRVVADRLGHASPAFTLAIYGHVLAGQDREAAEKLEAALRAAGKAG